MLAMLAIHKNLISHIDTFDKKFALMKIGKLNLDKNFI